MSDTMGKIYDAFISYRHSELDTFVAEQLHKELEAFRVPGRIVKEKKLKKQKIERVFRDKDELPLASNLTDHLITALKNSEFLIVVCTPRLPESQWCRKEIETFIQFHGRERVLLVLAEGEPEESFPDIMCQRERTIADAFGKSHTFMEPIDPLGADVRGKNKKEIKKKLKQELLRLTAVMFGCDYDDLKERHRERAFKRSLRISVSISVVLFGFGCFSNYQAQEIKKQYIETRKAQSEVMASVAKEKLEEGDRQESIEYALAALPENLQKPEYPINYDAVCTLTEALRVYDNGVLLKADMFLEQDAAIDYMKELEDGRFATVDRYDTLKIWELENKSVLASYDTAGFNVDLEDRCWMRDDEVLIYYDEESLNAVKTTEQKTLWSVSFSDRGKLIYNEGKKKLIAVNSSAIYEIDEKDGKILNEKPISWGIEYIKTISSVLSSKDGSYYYITGNNWEGESCIAMIDAVSLEKINEVIYPAEGLYSLAEGGDTLAVVAQKSLGDERKWYQSLEYRVLALDSKSLVQKWEHKSEEKIDWVAQTDDGKWLVPGSASLKKLDATTGEVSEMQTFGKRVLNVYVLTDGRLMLLMQDGSILFQDLETFEFLDITSDDCITEDWLKEFYYIGGNYITLRYGEKQMHLYNKMLAEGMEATEYVKEELLESTKDVNTFEYEEAVCEATKVIAVCNLEEQKLEFMSTEDRVVYATYDCKAKYLRHLCFTEDGKFLILQYENSEVEFLDMADFKIKATYNNMGSLASCEDINENYFVVKEIGTGYIINKSTLEMIAVIEGYVDYEEESNTFLVYNSGNDIYRVPFYSVEELVEMSK